MVLHLVGHGALHKVVAVVIARMAAQAASYKWVSGCSVRNLSTRPWSMKMEVGRHWNQTYEGVFA